MSNAVSQNDVRNSGSHADPRYKAILDRDRTWDGTFVFGVTSTGIYCRPSCPAKRPRADRVRYFSDVVGARDAGFRACKRCSPDSSGSTDRTTAAVLRALSKIDTTTSAVTLSDLANESNMSRAHFQRSFTRIVGCSPQEWQTSRRTENMRGLLAANTVASAAFEAGFDSLPGAYKAASKYTGMTPGRLKLGAVGETIFYTLVQSPLGYVLVAMTRNGVCRVMVGDESAIIETQFRDEVHAATLIKDDAAIVEVAQAVIGAASGNAFATTLPLDLRGTAFQRRVWKELTRIPRGETITYGELARRIGSPGAVRAAGTACGANPAALVVPCHRVKRGDGTLGGYRWGVERKERLLALEANSQQSPVDQTGNSISR